MGDARPRTTQRKRYRSPNGQQRPFQSGDRWYARSEVTLPDGTRRTVQGTGPTRKVAVERRDARIEQVLKQARLKDRPDLATVGAWCQHWLHSKQDIRPKTRVGYQAAVDKWIVPRLGTVDLHDVTLEMIEDLHREVQTPQRSRTHWVNVRTVLKQSFDEAVKRGHLRHNVVLYAPSPQAKKRSEAYLTEEQARAVFAACRTPSEQARTLMALVMGLRQGEALGLQWRDLSLDESTPMLRVRRTLQRVKGEGLTTCPPKTARSTRDLILPPPLAQALRTMRTLAKRQAMAHGRAWTDEGFVFTIKAGKPTDPTNDRKRWVALLQRARVPYVKLHAARHSAASMMLNDGTDLAVVADALGHSSVAVTADVYGHIAKETVGRATTNVAAKITG